MKGKQIVITGIIVCLIGATLVRVALVYTPPVWRPEPVKSMLGYIILAFGGYLVYRGKRRQRSEQGNK
jgi:hypothetical protein